MPRDARVFLDAGLRTVLGLVARVSGKVDVPGRTGRRTVGRIIAYRRVSARDQNPELQLDALHTHGHDRLFAEKEPGKRGVERPGFTAALSVLQPGDTLVFWKSDRWGRSAAHVLTTINELRDRGVDGEVAAGELRPGHQGRPVHVHGPGRRRVRTGTSRRTPGRGDRGRQAPPGRRPDAARQETHRRPKVTGPAEITTLRRLVADGTSVTQAARTLKISRSTAYAALGSTR